MAQPKIRSDRTAKPWTIALLLVGSALYVAALSTTLYEATSPSWLTWHVVLRKAYSVVAFATVGYLLRRSRVENGRFRVLLPCIAGMALYSASIELGQFFCSVYEGKPWEGLGWNAFDVACGALGGCLAVADRLAAAATRIRSS